MIPNPKSSPYRLLAVLAASLVLAGCAGTPGTETGRLQQQIENARTAADHSALETYYAGEASTARRKAAEHRAMGTRYQGTLTGGRGYGSMQAHCNAIAANHDDSALRYDALAAAHRQLAAQARP